MVNRMPNAGAIYRWLPSLLRRDLLPMLDGVRQRGDLVHVRTLLGKRVIVINNPEFINAAQKDFTLFVRGGFADGVIPIFGTKSLVRMNQGQGHEEIRDPLEPVFSHQSVAKFAGSFETIIEDQFAQWAAQGKIIHLDDLLKLNLKLLRTAAFSDAISEELLEQVALKSNECLDFILPAYFLKRLYFWLRPAGYKKFLADRGWIYKTIKEVLAKGDGQSDDVLGIFRAMIKQGVFRNMDEAVGALLTILQAGYDTTAGSMAALLHYLSANPVYLSNAAQELAELPTDGKHRSKWTKGIVKYVVGRFPSTIGLPRIVSRDEVFEGHQLYEDDIIFLNYWHEMHAHEMWEGVSPATYVDNELTNSQRQAGHPFGIAPYACIGIHLADLILQIMVKILTKYTTKEVESAVLGTRSGVLKVFGGWEVSEESIA